MTFNMGQRDRAKLMLVQLVGLQPNFISAHRYLASMHLIEGRDRAFLESLGTVARLSGNRDEQALSAAAAAGYAAGGRKEMLARMRTISDGSDGEGGFSGASTSARLALLAGDRPAANRWLERAIAENDKETIALPSDPVLSRLGAEILSRR
jgi:hypothetical protein